MTIVRAMGWDMRKDTQRGAWKKGAELGSSGRKKEPSPGVQGLRLVSLGACD